MSLMCPNCNGSGTKQGTKSRRVLDLNLDGEPAVNLIRVQRWQCSNCAQFYTTGFNSLKARSISTSAARDRVVEYCFQLGYAGAAERVGIDEKTARALWLDWAQGKNKNLVEQAPEFLSLHPIILAGNERLIVSDVQNKTIVDILEKTNFDLIEKWFTTLNSQYVHTVALSVHQTLKQNVQQILPQAQIVISPWDAQIAGVRAFLASLRSLRRMLGTGAVRNVREAPRLFAKQSDQLVEWEHEDMLGWDPSVLKLYQAKELFIQATEQTDSAKAKEYLIKAGKICSGIPQANLPAMFIRAWGIPIANGVEKTEFNTFTPELKELYIQCSNYKPVLPFDLFRSLAILKDGTQITYSSSETDDDEKSGVELNLGVPIEQVIRNFTR